MGREKVEWQGITDEAGGKSLSVTVKKVYNLQYK